jgi:hypothetical protein
MHGCMDAMDAMDEVEGCEIQQTGLPLLLTRESSLTLRVAKSLGSGQGGELIGEVAERPTAARPPAHHWGHRRVRQEEVLYCTGRIGENYLSLSKASGSM